MIDDGKKNVLGVLVDAVDYEAAVARIMAAAQARERCTCSALAVHGVMSGVLDSTHRYRLNQLDLVVPDGQPVRWALNWIHGADLRDRVYGPELTLRVCEAAAASGTEVFFYGSRPSVLTALTERLPSRFPGLRIAGTAPSRFRRLHPSERSEVVNTIRSSGAQIVFVGLGCPRQEVFAYEFGNDLGVPVLSVGAAFDFHAGQLAQAPDWMQACGLEWLFRLWKEPKRLARRYLLLNPLYSALLLAQKSGIARFDPANCEPPEEELLYA